MVPGAPLELLRVGEEAQRGAWRKRSQEGPGAHPPPSIPRTPPPLPPRPPPPLSPLSHLPSPPHFFPLFLPFLLLLPLPCSSFPSFLCAPFSSAPPPSPPPFLIFLLPFSSSSPPLSPCSTPPSPPSVHPSYRTAFAKKTASLPGEGTFHHRHPGLGCPGAALGRLSITSHGCRRQRCPGAPLTDVPASRLQNLCSQPSGGGARMDGLTGR